MKPPPTDPLDPLLDRWSEVPEPPPRLAANVWQRIATGEKSRDPATGWWLSLQDWFARPVFATGFVVACAFLGLFLAELRVSHVQRERSAQLARSYLLLIDPLLNTPPADRKP
ncbi:MAG TPA: hypothetical protein VG734_07630 [Lacunisphaera sp.]|nr:hypothetical protein [Lacunisphaera sp.]